MLGALARLAAGRRERMGVAKLGRKRGGGREPAVGSPRRRGGRRSSRSSMEQNMGCAVGACLGCVVDGHERDAAARLPRGPVFASDEINWEAGW
jgi:hypothetical protein